VGLLWSGHPMGKILVRKTIFFDCLPAPRDRPAKAIPWSPGSVCGWQTDKTQIPPCSSQGVKGDASSWDGRPTVLGMFAPSNRSRVHWVHLRVPPAKKTSKTRIPHCLRLGTISPFLGSAARQFLGLVTRRFLGPVARRASANRWCVRGQKPSQEDCPPPQPEAVATDNPRRHGARP
jgi:hypothetical protein